MKLRRTDLPLAAFAAVVSIGVAIVAWPSDAAGSATAAQELPSGSSHPTALFIGDSYTSGSGPEEQSYACRAAVAMGWVCRLSAIPGTGYINGGSSNRFVVNEYTRELTTSFTERIPRLAAMYRPDIVVLDGGRSDTLASPEGVYQAITSTVAQARSTWPDAELVFVRPRMLADPRAPAQVDDVLMQRLERDPATAGVHFIDPIGAEFAGTDTLPLIGEDEVSPNERGDVALGVALVESLRSQKVSG